MKSKASHANTLKRWQLASVYLYECALMIEEPIELLLEYLRGINHGRGQTMKLIWSDQTQATYLQFFLLDLWAVYRTELPVNPIQRAIQ